MNSKNCLEEPLAGSGDTRQHVPMECSLKRYAGYVPFWVLYLKGTRQPISLCVYIFPF